MAHSYRCPNCAANLLFNPDTKRMTCGFCEAKISPHDILSKEGTEGFFVGDQWEDAESYSCSGCGAEFIVGETAMTSTCVYCDSESIITSRLSSGAKPAYIIPFRYGKERAQESFLKWCKGKNLLPRNFTSRNNVESITGVYIPVWLYDYPVDVNMILETATSNEIEDGSLSSSGNYERNKGGFLFWRRIPIDASLRIPAELMEQIEPYNYSYIQKFESKYLSGFVAERPEIDRRKIDRSARERIEKYVYDAALDSIENEDILIGFRDESQYHRPVAEFAFLPVWFLHYKYLGHDYKFVLNGQTGEVAGDAPISAVKLALLSILCSASVMGVLYLLGVVWRMILQ